MTPMIARARRAWHAWRTDPGPAGITGWRQIGATTADVPPGFEPIGGTGPPVKIIDPRPETIGYRPPLRPAAAPVTAPLILACRHLDAAEGVMRAGHVVTVDDVAAIALVLRYVSAASLGRDEARRG